jgi:hypothetical protein
MFFEARFVASLQIADELAHLKVGDIDSIGAGVSRAAASKVR